MYGRVVENLAALGDLVTQAADLGAELLVLPEMAWTGYLWPDAPTLWPLAEETGGGTGQDALQALALRLGVALVYGFPERSGQALYNSQALTTPEGKPQRVYRKTHLFDADTWWAQPGNTGFLQWQWRGRRVGSGICMDLNYPDLVEYHVTGATDVLAFSTNWLDQGFDVVPYWEASLATPAPFEGWALFANRSGSEFGVGFRGQSAIFHRGRCLASLGHQDGVLVIDLETGEATTSGPGKGHRGFHG